MAALLKTLRRTANDFRPASHATIVAFAQRHTPSPWAAAAAFAALLAATAFGALWMVESRKPVEVKIIPAPSPPAKIIVKLEHETVPAKPDLSSRQKYNDQKYNDIVLPIESLAPDDASIAPPPENAPAIQVISEKLEDTPAMRPLPLPPSSLSPSQKSSVAFMPDAASTQEQMLEDAQLYLQSGNNEAALQLYDRILARNKNSIAALQGKMYALQRLGQFENAIDTGHKLLRIDPQNISARINLVSSLGQSYLPASQTELERMVAANPDDAAAHDALAKLLMRRGYYEQAFAHLSRATQIAPDNLSYRLDLATLYDRAGHTEAAIAQYRQVMHAYAEREEGGYAQASYYALHRRIEFLEAKMAVSQK